MSERAAGGLMGSHHEIVELTEKNDSRAKIGSINPIEPLMKQSTKDDINKLFKAIDIRNSSQGVHFRGKSMMKRPMRVGPSGIGISEAANLKQALRGLCISQASEMAAMKKRTSRPSASPGVPEVGAIKKLYGSVVINAGEVSSSWSHNEGKLNLVKIFFVPETHSTGVVMRGDRELKAAVSQSSKGNLRECSSSTASHGGESSLSVYSGPHMSKGSGWEAIRSVQKEKGSLRWGDFKLLRRLGGRNIAAVYLCELIGTGRLFVAKVVDNDESKKIERAQMERDILGILDHPFLPMLYAYFVEDEFSCLVMEYCPGGDLRALGLKRQPHGCFSEKEARFYAAEVLVALEYLHMLGVVHRDLRPDNILIQGDGHIMLSDFDSSLRCAENPPRPPPNSPPEPTPARNLSNPCPAYICINPPCLQLSHQLSCLPAGSRARTLKSEQVIPIPHLVVVPTSTARSNSIVGTHDEYLAPEIIKGEEHGSPADWWAFGIFLYELLYGETPFKGGNVMSQRLEFPQCPLVSHRAKDLIIRLLVKDPGNRMGSTKGAAEIKHHAFFDGLNWALIRQQTPPEVPEFIVSGIVESKVEVGML